MKTTLSILLALVLALSIGAFASAEDERITISVMGIDWGYGPSSNSSMEQWWEDLFDVNLDIQWVNYILFSMSYEKDLKFSLSDNFFFLLN